MCVILRMCAVAISKVCIEPELHYVACDSSVMVHWSEVQKYNCIELQHQTPARGFTNHKKFSKCRGHGSQ